MCFFPCVTSFEEKWLSNTGLIFLPSAVQKQKLEYTELQFCLWLCMGVKLGL
jgi:hypothetical protein